MIAALRLRLHESFVRWALRIRPPEPTPIFLSQRRVYVLPTRPGLAYAATLLAILVGAMNYNLSLGHAVVFLLGGLGVVAILHTFRNLVHLRLRPGRCEPVFAGELARFELLLDNARNEPRTALRLFIADEAPLEVDVAGGSTTVATLRLQAPRRGWLALPRITLETTWPLGLIRTWAYAAPDMRCLVYPSPAAVAPALTFSGDAARGSSRDGQGSDDFAGLRSHQDADPPRHIAWKAVARQIDGPLLTKLFAGAATRQVMLDWNALPSAMGVEERLSVLARWMLDADAAGLAWGLTVPDRRLPPAQGGAQLAAGLRILALYGNPDDGTP